MSKLLDLAKQINKDFGSNVVTLGAKHYDTTRIPFTSSRANYCLYGGVPTNKAVEFFGPEHSGKAQPLDAKVVTKDGYKNIGDVKIGDMIFCDDGKEHMILGVFPQGKKPIYRVTFRDGRSTRCSDEHLWSYNPANKLKSGKTEYVTKTLNEIMNDYKKNDNRKISYYIPTTLPVQFEKKELPIDSYILGLLLGDGGFTCNSLTFSSGESDLIQQVSNCAGEYNCELHTRYSENCSESTICEKSKSNNHPIKTILRNLDLLGKHSYDKFIPAIYKYSSIEQRIKILAGIINTDGTISRDKSISITTVSPKLKDDILEILRSLGLYATFSIDGREYSHGYCYTIFIHTTDVFNKYLSIKHIKKGINKAHRERRNIMNKFDYLGEEECICISVNSPNRLYLTDDYIVTHNTTSALDIVANAQIIESENHLNKLHEVKDLIEELGESGGKKLDLAQKELTALMEVGPRKCVYVDAENTLDIKWAEKLGVDVDNMILIQPQEQSAEQVLQMILDVIDTGEAAVVVLDSVAMLVPQNILEEGMDKKSYCGVAGPMTVFCAKISGTGRLTKNNTLLILINQIREDIANPYNAYNSPGGKALKHTAAIRMLFRHGSFLDDNNNELALKNAGTPFGNKVDFTIVKTKCCKPDRRLGFYTLKYETGIDYVSDLLDLAIKYDLIQKSGAWFELSNGEKLQGLNKVREYYTDHFQEYQELDVQVKEIMISEQ